MVEGASGPMGGPRTTPSQKAESASVEGCARVPRLLHRHRHRRHHQHRSDWFVEADMIDTDHLLLEKDQVGTHSRRHRPGPSTHSGHAGSRTAPGRKVPASAGVSAWTAEASPGGVVVGVGRGGRSTCLAVEAGGIPLEGWAASGSSRRERKAKRRDGDDRGCLMVGQGGEGVIVIVRIVN